jgi:hypothetical protein
VFAQCATNAPEPWCIGLKVWFEVRTNTKALNDIIEGYRVGRVDWGWETAEARTWISWSRLVHKTVRHAQVKAYFNLEDRDLTAHEALATVVPSYGSLVNP